MTATLGSFCVPPILSSLKIGSPMPPRFQAAYISEYPCVVKGEVSPDVDFQAIGGMSAITWASQAISSNDTSTYQDPLRRLTNCSLHYRRIYWHIPSILRNVIGFRRRHYPCYTQPLACSPSKPRLSTISVLRGSSWVMNWQMRSTSPDPRRFSWP